MRRAGLFWGWGQGAYGRRMPRGNQVVRQWRVLRLLEGSAAGLRVGEIREALGGMTTERTVFRDLEDLQAAGFALVSAGGLWRVMGAGAGARIPVEPSEVLALQLAAEALGAAAGPQGSALDSLIDKVHSTLTPVGRRFVEEMRAAQVASHGLPSRGDALEAAAAELMHEAIQKQQVVRLRYRSPYTGVTERGFEPYTQWCFEGRAYVIGLCRLRKAVRVLSLARIEHGELTDEPFEADPSFDPRQHVAGGFGVWLGEPHAVELELAADAAHLARERCFHPEQVLTERPDGGVHLAMEVAGLPALARWVAGSGGSVRVVAPQLLQQMVQEIHLAGLGVTAMKPPVATRPSGSRKVAQE